ncbi:hypothetical protein H5410_052787 [Solanum commersonii]|uniref:Uncharacterized protein n=1 Tax=Solanum commersonii TaxID=4109 RepID=A0A9J5X562_SOLCO|nr:hypothetical protein H5410_052787 [Solanum commersonii]
MAMTKKTKTKLTVDNNNNATSSGELVSNQTDSSELATNNRRNPTAATSSPANQRAPSSDELVIQAPTSKIRRPASSKLEQHTTTESFDERQITINLFHKHDLKRPNPTGTGKKNYVEAENKYNIVRRSSCTRKEKSESYKEKKSLKVYQVGVNEEKIFLSIKEEGISQRKVCTYKERSKLNLFTK